jgi:hypothetical protein
VQYEDDTGLISVLSHLGVRPEALGGHGSEP